jgi:hypothetical protein
MCRPAEAVLTVRSVKLAMASYRIRYHTGAWIIMDARGWQRTRDTQKY